MPPQASCAALASWRETCAAKTRCRRKRPSSLAKPPSRQERQALRIDPEVDLRREESRSLSDSIETAGSITLVASVRTLDEIRPAVIADRCDAPSWPLGERPITALQPSPRRPYPFPFFKISMLPLLLLSRIWQAPPPIFPFSESELKSPETVMGKSEWILPNEVLAATA